jgi:hypothetical protein
VKDQLVKGKAGSGDAASSNFGRFMQILARQNYVGTDTKTVLTKGFKDQLRGIEVL